MMWGLGMVGHANIPLVAWGALALVGGLFAALGVVVMVRRWPSLAMALLIVAVYTNRYKLEVGPVSIRAEQVAVLILAGLIVLRVLVYGDRPRITVPGLYAIGWWMALAWSAFLHAPDLADTVRHIIRLALMVLALLVTVNLVTTEWDWRRLFRYLYIVGVLEAGYGVLMRALYGRSLSGVPLLGRFLPDPWTLGVQVTTSLPVPAPYGTLEEGNIFGSTMGALLIVSLALWTHPEAGISRRWSGVGILLTAAGWILSLTRGAWLSVAMVLPLFWVLYPRTPEKRLAHLAVLIVAAPVALAAVVTLLLFAPASSPVVARLQTLTQLYADPTFSLRMGRWDLAWMDIVMRPIIGWGPGTFVQLHGIRFFAPAWLDSLTIKTLQEAGLFGLVFFYGLWATTLGDGMRALLDRASASYRGIVLGLTLGGLVLFLAYHATDATWLGYMWVWLGCLTVRPGGLWTRYERA